MSTIHDWKDGRRWFSAAVIVVGFMLLTLLVSPAVGRAKLPQDDADHQGFSHGGKTGLAAPAVSYSSRSVVLTHDGQGSTVHVHDQYSDPSSGFTYIAISSEVDNIQVTADGAPLSFTAQRNPTYPETNVNVHIPDGTAALVLNYDRLDGALVHDDNWHYDGDNLVWDLSFEPVWGPATVVVNLPDDASIVRNSSETYATIVDSHTVRFKPPVGVRVDLWVIYRTADMPATYETTWTPHLKVNAPVAYEPYREVLLSMLENAYVLFQEYTGQDVNEIRSQSHYDFSYSPYPLCYSAGLTIRGGPSSVLAEYVPFAYVPATTANNQLVGKTFHELGNGWWLLFCPDYWTEPTLPWWIASEAHSGFLRSQVTLDLGYCAQAQAEHASHYEDYLACKSGLPGSIPCSGLVETMLVSLQAKYGWDPFRAIYTGVQEGTLDLSGLSDAEKDSAMIRFLSLAVGENLIPFYEEHGIYADAAVQAELSSLPVGDVPILDELACRSPMITYTPHSVSLAGLETKTVYVGAPYNWTFTVDPPVSWLNVGRHGNYPFATLEVTAASQNVAQGAAAGSINTADIVITSDPPTSNSPVRIPVSYTPQTGIAGAVTDAFDGSYLEGIRVTAYSDDSASGNWWSVSETLTGEYGHYAFIPLDPGTYRVGFADDSGLLLEQFYDNVPDLDSAQDITLAAGELVQDVDAAMATGGQILGMVTADEDGSPLQGINVEVYQYDRGEDTWVWMAYAMTGDDGQYTAAGLPSGTFYVRFWDSLALYSEEYYDDVPDLNQATALPVVPGQKISGVDAALSPTGSITGRVVSELDDSPLPDITVQTWRFIGLCNCWLDTNTTTTTADGSYRIDGLNSGPYRVKFVDFSGVYAEEFFQNAPDLANAQEVVVIGGSSTEHIDAALGLTGQIAGVVTADSDGLPLADITVSAVRYDHLSKSWGARSVTATGSSGDYLIESLSPGSYRILLQDYSGTYAPQYFDGFLDPAAATEVVVNSGETTSGIDAALAPPEVPENDDFDRAMVINTLPYRRAQVVLAATADAEDPVMPCGDEQGYNTVWYQYRPQANGPVTISTIDSDYDTVLALWQGSQDNLTIVACNDDYYLTQAALDNIDLAAGTTYFIEIAGFSPGYAGILLLDLHAEPEKHEVFAPVVARSQPVNTALARR